MVGIRCIGQFHIVAAFIRLCDHFGRIGDEVTGGILVIVGAGFRGSDLNRIVVCGVSLCGHADGCAVAHLAG